MPGDDQSHAPGCRDYPIWIATDEDGRDILLDLGHKGHFLRVCRPEDSHWVPDGGPLPRTPEQARAIIAEGQRRREEMALAPFEANGVTVSSQVISQPGFPGHEVRVLDVEPRELQGNRFRLWLPENVIAKDYNQPVTTEVRWETVEGGAKLKGYALPGPPIKLDIEIDVHADHLDFRLLLENNSPTIQEDIEINICLQVAGAPDFRDQQGERTFVWCGGRLQCINDAGTPAQTHLRFHPDKSCFATCEDQHHGFGFIGVRSRSGTPMAMAWPSHSRYLCNTSIGMCCLHANPFLDRLDAGGSRTIRGWLGWRGENLDDLCRRAGDALAAGTER